MSFWRIRVEARGEATRDDGALVCYIRKEEGGREAKQHKAKANEPWEESVTDVV